MKTFFKVTKTICETIGLTMFGILCVGLHDRVKKYGRTGYLEELKNGRNEASKKEEKEHEKEKQYVIKDIHTINTIGF